MADAKEVKKDDKKPAAPAGSHLWEEILLLVLGVVALLFVFIPRFFPSEPTVVTGGTTQSAPFSFKTFYNNLFNDHQETIKDNAGNVVQVVQEPSLATQGKERLSDFFQSFMVIFIASFIFLILLFKVVLYYIKFKTDLIKAAYKKKFEPEKDTEKANEAILQKSAPDNNGIINPRWQVVGKYYNSASQSDWKLAILEADIMLYDVLKNSGFPGDSIGEMLKNTDRSKLQTLDLAWSAHKVRNEIAHQGLDYVLSRSTVETCISQFEQVFNELNFI